jgi:iron complex transport system substrate-binding protein
VLVQCGTEAPALEGELEGASVVEIPVATIYSESTSHLGFIDVLDLEGAVTGVSDGSWVVTPSIRERIDAGEVDSFNTTMVIDTEMVVAADPDVFITGGYDDPAHETIADAGVPVVANAEWLETTPEGWAEWVGLFAALTNTEARASELYAEWVVAYEAAAALVGGVTERPTVMTGGLYEGTWFANGGAGIAAEFIADAGGDYIYDDNEDTGSIELDIETALTDGADAEVWLLASGFTTEADAEAADPRNTEFAAWDDGGVWINSVPSDPTVNPYEQGPVMIDEYLLDYIKILHPELVPDHELVFFSQVPQS